MMQSNNTITQAHQLYIKEGPSDRGVLACLSYLQRMTIEDLLYNGHSINTVECLGAHWTTVHSGSGLRLLQVGL